ncbi:MAG TPA: hypothetical protein VND64_37730 [Pirellulales bacterium]|nr:hypothetical protein [Pirellulales bacterium]
MSLPEFNEFGDFPEGVYPTSIAELVARLGTGSVQREVVSGRLERIYELANRTGKLDRLIVFGSYVSDEPAPNDVDVILVMRDDFRPNSCSQEVLALFDHHRATDELGASVFWVRPAMLLGRSLDEFIAHWKVKRDGRRRGIVEIKA